LHTYPMCRVFTLNPSM